jgi:hypothetical protein
MHNYSRKSAADLFVYNVHVMWEKCAAWPGLEPRTLGIPYRGSTDW